MQVHVVRPEEVGRSERESWNGLLTTHPYLDDPFLTPEFADLVASVRGGARVAVLEDGGCTGYFPFESHALGLGRPIGHGLCDFQAVIAADDLLDGPALLRGCGRTLLRFDHLDARQARLLGVRRAAECAAPYLDLRHGYDYYASERRRVSRTLLSTTERKARKLGREVGELRFEAESADHALLDRLITWKRDQYRRTCVPDVLTQHETRNLLHRVVDASEPGFSGVLTVLVAGDRPVAAHLGVRTGSTLTWWLPGYDPVFASFSPGVMLALRLAEWAAGTGVKRVDLGKGDEHYKQRLKSGDRILADGWLASPLVAKSFGYAHRMRGRLRRPREHVRKPTETSRGETSPIETPEVATK